MTYYTRSFSPQPTQRVASTDLKNEFQAVKNALDAVEVDVGKGVRAPEATTALPNAASRALKVMSFDASGNPRTTIAEVDLAAAATAASNAAASAGSSAASAVESEGFADAAALSAAAADASADAALAAAASIAGGPVTSVNGMAGIVTGLQEALVSGTNIKTVNGASLLGAGDLVTPIGASPDSIVVLTSGTSWTCPAGVTKAVLTVVGGCGGKGHGSSTGAPGGGGAGGFAKDIVSLTPGSAYSYAIGAAGGYGLWVVGSGASGTGGGASTFTVGANTYTGGGGGGGGGSTSAQGGTPGAGGVGSAPSGLAGRGPEGARGDNSVVANYGTGGVSTAGTWGGGTSVYSDAGRIILELYK